MDFTLSYTVIIIIVTALISFAAFSNEEITNKLILWPRYMKSPAEYYRFLTSGFIHADIAHLGFNMFTLYFCGESMELIMSIVASKWLFIVLYLSAIIISSIPSYIKHRHNSYFRSLGASGGVAAVLFATIYYSPWSMIYVYFIKMPSILFAFIYLGYSVYMSRRGGDNINHDAHLWGSIYGFVFAFLVDPSHGATFINAITHLR